MTKDSNLIWEAYTNHLNEDLDTNADSTIVDKKDNPTTEKREVQIGQEITTLAETLLKNVPDDNNIHDDLQSIISLAEELINLHKIESSNTSKLPEQP